MEPVRTTAPDDNEAWWWWLDPRRGLCARATLVLGGGAVAFALLLGWAAGAMLQRQLDRQLGPAFATLAFQVNDKLDRGIYERMHALQFAATLAPLRTPTATADERRRVLDALLFSSPDYAWIGFADPAGKVVCAAQHVLEATPVASAAWFRGGQRQPYAGSVHEFAELARELVLTNDENPRFLDLAVPVTGADGKLVGVLGAQLHWTWARDIQASVVPATARREHVSVTVYSTTGEALLDSGGSGWTLPPDAPSVGAQPALRGYFQEIVPGDTTYLTGYSRSRGHQDFRGLNWLVTVRQPATVAFAAVAELRRWIVRLGLAFAGIVAVLSWFFTARLTHRMATIGTAAGRIGSGDILALIPQPPGPGELQRMCAALNGMVDQLRRRAETLEADNTRLRSRGHAQVREPKS